MIEVEVEGFPLQPVMLENRNTNINADNLTSSCHSTRSSPVTISVTGCSTCSRVFLQMRN